MNPAWKPLPDYENSYAACEDGRIKSLERIITVKKEEKIFYRKQAELILCQVSDGKGYANVVLSAKAKPFKKLVHRLIAIAFIPNPEHKPQVNHIDGNKMNNHASNLEWCTQKENSIHASEIGLLGKARLLPKSRKYVKLNNKKLRPVNQYDENGNLITQWRSAFQIRKDLKINPYHCLGGRDSSAGGFIFKYANA